MSGVAASAFQPAPASPQPAADRAPLAVRSLRLTGFRSYAGLRLESGPGCVVLSGPNGAGKTNLLEALSLLAPGRGLRRARLEEMARRLPGQDPGEAAQAGWAIAARLDTAQGELAIGTGLEAGAASTRRAVRIDGIAASSQLALGQHVAAVWLTPQLDRLFAEGAGGRRRFLDRMVTGFDPDHAGRAAAYDNALRQRARLLGEGRADAAWLAALEDTMARHGVAVAIARQEIVARLDQASRLGVGPFPRGALALKGEIDAWVAQMAAIDAEEKLRAALAGSRRADAESGGAAIGPHRSDLGVTHLDRGRPAAECSTGEQKALLVALVLAHARLAAIARGAPPLLLLDEIAAHLDRGRLAALFAELLALGAQAWMSGTDAETFAPLRGRAQFFAVEDGAVAVDA
ncbi:MAG: DNA replication/repair protein RecF [Reyranellaceae bacterium]